MRDYYAKYICDESLLIREEGWVRSLQGIRETQFALGNGFVGSRAILEEMPYDAKPGTYISGVYDDVGSQVDELVNLPNPFNFRISANKEKLGVISMDVERHTRYLNMCHGMLVRHTVFYDTDKRRYDYQSARFISMADKNIMVMQIVFTPLDGNADISIQTGLDTSVYNAGTATEGRKRHFRVKELGQFDNEGYLIIETFNKLHTVIYRSGFYYETQGKRIMAEDNVFEMKLHKNQTVVFTKIVHIDTIPKEGSLEKLKEESEKKFRKAFNSNAKLLLSRHVKAWEDLWSVADVAMWGAPEVEKNFRFNIYHMLIAAKTGDGSSSIGAKTLTGEGYRGHIFWDAEIFFMPFYIYTLPDVARNMLLYRYKRLNQARELAKKNGYKGAMFPWESAATGEEETPDRARDLDGKIIKIYTGQREHHITADVAYGVYHYYSVTLDEKFLREYGYEILFETARFWVSRSIYNKNTKKYEIRHVIGPDEFHEDVNNNAFTNVMAKWNLNIACRMFQKLKKQEPDLYKYLSRALNLSLKEVAKWKEIENKLKMNIGKNQIIEQFDGFFKKTKVKITNWDENSIPIVSSKLTPRDYGKTQLIKQADVILLFHLLPQIFNPAMKRKNYEYYLERTTHNSSLSLPVYAIVAADVDDRNIAYRFFNTALRTDISNIHENTFDGIHAACIGGTWQVVVMGFAGVRIDKGILSVNPKIPNTWRKLIFSLLWQGQRLKFEMKNDKVKVQALTNGKKKQKIKIRIFSTVKELKGSAVYTFLQKKPIEKKKAYYL